MDANRRECEKGSWVVISGLAFIGVYSRLGFKAGQLSVGVCVTGVTHWSIPSRDKMFPFPKLFILLQFGLTTAD